MNELTPETLAEGERLLANRALLGSWGHAPVFGWLNTNADALIAAARERDAYHQQLLHKEEERADCSAKVKQLLVERDALRVEIERLKRRECSQPGGKHSKHSDSTGTYCTWCAVSLP